jgi:hypothetical protein
MRHRKWKLTKVSAVEAVLVAHAAFFQNGVLDDGVLGVNIVSRNTTIDASHRRLAAVVLVVLGIVGRHLGQPQKAWAA